MDNKFNKPPESRGPDRLNISDRGGEVADIMAAISRLPEVRESRVRAIKERIYSGIYVVDPRKIAESILKNI